MQPQQVNLQEILATLGAKELEIIALRKNEARLLARLKELEPKKEREDE